MLCVFLAGTPALRLAPPVMQLQRTAVSAPGFTGRVVPTKAQEPAAQLAQVDGTALSGNAMEDLWDKSRGRPLRRSLALWLFSMKATWKIIRAHKNEARQVETASWVRDELLRLGPTMIKLGQVASARTDLLSQPYIDALVALQDSVPTISAERVAQLVDEELGKPVDTVFDKFDMTPIAGASLGQVHRASLGGTPVAVKVQRRNLRELFDTDFFNIRLMARIGNFFEKRLSKPKAGATTRDWLKYTDDAARLLYMEIDYRNEAKNARLFSDSVAEDASVVVPQVFDNATTSRLLTMEYIGWRKAPSALPEDTAPCALRVALGSRSLIHKPERSAASAARLRPLQVEMILPLSTTRYINSVKLTDERALAAYGLDRKKLSKQVVDIFLTQLLKTGVLHCDPHPGNMCVDAKGRLVFYDFGMLDTIEACQRPATCRLPCSRTAPHAPP